MRLNLAQLMNEPSGTHREYIIDEYFDFTNGQGSRQLLGSIELTRTDAGVWASARLKTASTSSCCRCLNGYEHPILMSIEEEISQSHERKMGTTVDCEPTEVLSIDSNQILDLTDAIHQYASLSLPMKPICHPDCKGLCLLCGSDMNQSPCKCDTRISRWDGLRITSIEHNKTEEPIR